ncbi:unnamed protein product, partial [Adineta steineri]
FHMFLDPSGTNNTNEQNLQTSRGYAFAEFASNEIAQTVINKLNGLDLGGFRLVVDLLSNQAEPIINLFEQLCATTTTTVTSSNKNDPRLANATTSQSQAATTALAAMESVNSNVTSTGNKEERESIS